MAPASFQLGFLRQGRKSGKGRHDLRFVDEANVGRFCEVITDRRDVRADGRIKETRADADHGRIGQIDGVLP